ncbi:MAG: (5-formylfuran-3-yl)methyl phosphate synthase [Burkholderiales bacterium]
MTALQTNQVQQAEPHRTKLLASVMNLEEAQIALDGGADIIDLKNPLAGALGALPLDDIRTIVKMINRQRPVSATIGDLPMEPEIICAAVEATANTGVDYIKIGFFKSENLRDCIAALSPLAQKHKLIAVLFADQQPDFSLLDDLAKAGFHGVMLDTADKQNGSLSNHIQVIDLIEFILQSCKHDLLCGLAGSLRIGDVKEMLELKPDYLGFRSTLCQGSVREQKLSMGKLKTLKNAFTFSGNVITQFLQPANVNCNHYIQQRTPTQSS